MKLQKFSLIATLAAFLCAISLRTASAADAPPTQLAVLNVVKLFASLDEQKAGQAELDKLDHDNDRTRRLKEEDLKKRADSLKPGTAACTPSARPITSRPRKISSRPPWTTSPSSPSPT